MKKKISISILVALPLLLVGFNYANEKYFEIAKNLDIFATLFKEVNAHYVDEVDPEELVKVGIDAMLESLDPYTNYIPEEDLESFRTITTGQYAGIGVLVGNINGKVKVTRIYKGHSADREGVKVGDQIISVAGTEIKSGSIPEIGQLLRGQTSSDVEVTLLRGPDKEIIKLTLHRENITVGNVPYYGLINPRVGYIKLEDFAIGAGREVKEALLTLKSNGANSVVLDLRGNGGGLLSEAVNVSNLFIKKGLPVVSTKGRIKDWNKTYKALNSPIDTSMPLVVLIDEESASASEIVAGVLQDYDRAILIGRNTFGKGLVQTTRPLTYNAQLKVTTAKYYIPSGRCIQAINYTGDEPLEVDKNERMAFKTANGRTIYDGSGLRPDFEIDEIFYSAIARKLSYEGYLFDYAMEFSYKNPGIRSARDIQLTDAQYNEFVDWIKAQNFSYETDMEGYLTDLESIAEEEQYLEKLTSELKALRNNIEKNKEKDLLHFKEEIRNLLENEISAVLFNYNGEIENSFTRDKDVRKAVDILSDQQQYNQILGF